MVLAVLLAVVLAAAACGSGTGSSSGDGPALPDRGPDIEGTVTSTSATPPPTDDCVPPGDDPDGSVSSDDPPACFDPEEAPLGTIVVETDPDGDGGDKGSLSIDRDTVVVDADGNELRFRDLEAGYSVRAWHTGEVAESFPWQARAVAVEVLNVALLTRDG